jgi:hypothetical protein
MVAFSLECRRYFTFLIHHAALLETFCGGKMQRLFYFFHAVCSGRTLDGMFTIIFTFLENVGVKLCLNALTREIQIAFF